MLDLQGYGPRLIEGAGVTVQLAVLSLILAILLGLLTASAKMSRNWLLRRTATVYTTEGPLKPGDGGLQVQG